MSIITLFTKKAPTLAGYTFDAVLEDTFEASVEWTQYPIESGANAVDHGIIEPFRWRLIGAVSNNPLRPTLTDFIGGVASEFLGDSAIIASVAGLSAGFLAGSNETRASETLSFLLSLMVARQPFDIDAGDIQLSNMVISEIRRDKNPANEGGLIFDAQLQELPTLDVISTRQQSQPSQDQLRDGDPAKTQAAREVNKGEASPTSTTAATAAQVGAL